MRRYLVTVGKPTPSQQVLIDERKKAIEAGLRPPEIQLSGKGKFISAGEFEEEEGGFMLVECTDPTEFLSDVSHILLNAEIKPVTLCPSDCKGCPPSTVVPPLRSE